MFPRMFAHLAARLATASLLAGLALASVFASASGQTPDSSFFPPALTAEYLDGEGELLRTSTAVVVSGGVIVPATFLQDAARVRLTGVDGYRAASDQILAFKADVNLALLGLDRLPSFALEVSEDPTYRIGMELLLVRGPAGEGPEWTTTHVLEKFSLRGPDFLALSEGLASGAAAYGPDGSLFGLAFRLEGEAEPVPYLVTSVSIRKLLSVRGEAVDLEDLALPAPPDFLDPTTTDGLLFRGAHLLLAGRSEDARVLVAQAAKRDPNLPLTHFWLGKVEFEEKNWNTAADEFWYAAQADTTWSLAWRMSGAALHRAEAYTDAIRMYERALLADPKSAQAELHLGSAYYELGQFPEAIAAFERAIALEPGLGLAYFNLARTHQAEGDRAEAEEVYLRLKERNETWAQNLRKALDARPEAK